MQMQIAFSIHVEYVDGYKDCGAQQSEDGDNDYINTNYVGMTCQIFF